MKVWRKIKNKIVIAALLAVLVLSLGFVTAVGPSAVVSVMQSNIVGAVALDTSVDISNTTGEMTTLFVTLITLMIPLIIIMAYLGIFQDFIAAIGRAFGGLFGRH